jgi:hypothetical protein
MNNISLSNIRQNKALTKLLVLAKREKVKEEFRKKQQQLDNDIKTALIENESMSVEVLMLKFGKTSGEWPSAMDVQVHLQRRVNHGELLSLCNSHVEVNVTLKSTIQLNTSLY